MRSERRRRPPAEFLQPEIEIPFQLGLDSLRLEILSSRSGSRRLRRAQFSQGTCAIEQPFHRPLLFVAELGEESSDGPLVFENRSLQAVERGEKGCETCRQHWCLAHDFLDDRRMAADPRRQPRQVLQVRFRRLAAELIYRHFTEDRASLPAGAHTDGVLPIHADLGGLNPASRRASDNTDNRPFRRHSFTVAWPLPEPLPGHPARPAPALFPTGFASLSVTARRTARSAALAHTPWISAPLKPSVPSARSLELMPGAKGFFRR